MGAAVSPRWGARDRASPVRGQRLLQVPWDSSVPSTGPLGQGCPQWEREVGVPRVGWGVCCYLREVQRWGQALLRDTPHTTADAFPGAGRGTCVTARVVKLEALGTSGTPARCQTQLRLPKEKASRGKIKKPGQQHTRKPHVAVKSTTTTFPKQVLKQAKCGTHPLPRPPPQRSLREKRKRAAAQTLPHRQELW